MLLLQNTVLREGRRINALGKLQNEVSTCKTRSQILNTRETYVREGKSISQATHMKSQKGKTKEGGRILNRNQTREQFSFLHYTGVLKR
jgi:hypothetical protein